MITDFKIISLNINGLRQKIDFIDENFIHIDVLCIQESKLNHHLANTKLFKNFTDFHITDSTLPGQKGVSFLFNNKSIKNNKIQIKNVEEIILDDNHGRLCLCNLLINNIYDIYIINIYAHHISNIKDNIKIKKKNNFYNLLTNYINHNFKNKNLIILGDFNANKSRDKEFICPSYKKPPPGFYDVEINIYKHFLNNTKLINLYEFKGIYSYYSQRTKVPFIMLKHNKGLSVDSIMINENTKQLIKKYKFEILKKYYKLSDHLPLYLKITFF
jgi:exodeoxyribonuclease III